MFIKFYELVVVIILIYITLWIHIRKWLGKKVDERIPENLFINMMIEKANIIKDHLHKSTHPLIIVANI